MIVGKNRFLKRSTMKEALNRRWNLELGVHAGLGGESLVVLEDIAYVGIVEGIMDGIAN